MYEKIVFPVKASLLMLHSEKFIATCYNKANIIILIVFNIVYMFLISFWFWFHSNLSLIIYRQSHKSFFSKSDLLFICMLKPRNFDIEKQNLEIEAAQVFLFFYFFLAILLQRLFFFASTCLGL